MLLDYPTEKVQPSFAAVFARALTDPARPTPVDVVGPRGKAAIKRYDVYRNNVTVSLINALAATYPAVQRITGVEFFHAMARFHIRATPPTSRRPPCSSARRIPPSPPSFPARAAPPRWSRTPS